MNNTTNLEILKASSRIIIANGTVGNSMILAMGILGLLVSSCQVILTFLWKPLRDKQQILVVNAVLADALKAISFGVIGAKRLFLAFTESDEVITQYDCMFWILTVAFTSLYGLLSVLTLSVERLAVIATPIWYKNNKPKILWTLAIASFLLSAIASGFLFLGASSELLFLSCNLLSSTTAEYYSFLLYFQDVTTGFIVLVNCATCFMLTRRWRAAKKAKRDMNVFKKEVQFNAIKAVFSVVVLCLVSFFAATVFMAVIQTFDPVLRAYYGPFWGCFQLARGVFDFILWLLCSNVYRNGFIEVFAKRTCLRAASVQPISLH